MDLLYKGSYNQRFEKIYGMIEGRNVVELCFGDIIIAEHCRQRGIRWTGFDMNTKFVRHAKKKGFDARLADVKRISELPTADLCIIAGSLYHFAENIESLILKMMHSAQRIIISEPIHNLSNRSDLVGYLARRSTSCGEKHEQFRFTQSTFKDMLFHLSAKHRFRFKLMDTVKKDIIAVLDRNPNKG
jgi:hypothetical protein